MDVICIYMVVLYACAHMQLQLDICAYDFPYTYQLIYRLCIYIVI